MSAPSVPKRGCRSVAGKTIGVLALQGAFVEHEAALRKCGALVRQVRKPEEIQEVDGLIIPGGESTTIGKLMNKYGLDKVIVDRAAQGMPIWGTCAGMILLAKEIVDSDQLRLGLMDISVKRNGFGRQVESFEADLEVESIGPTRGVFIRAPYGEKAGDGVHIMARFKEKIVMAQQYNLLCTAFHPELTQDLCIHRYFLTMV
ncbi:MAG: pyridoxal 5'-phosphate synthase glutaminase subunit PdxT [Syntrophomonadaceae bacterium]|nr:pyridoxal 5'-phosphate synthase glutaminase subunit PdxT [Syntrophomonadaceae bacterium]